MGDTVGFLFFPVLSAPPQLRGLEGGEIFGCGRNKFPELATQNPPHSANFTFQVFLALCGGLCGAAGGVPPTNLLPSHMAEDKKWWHLKKCLKPLNFILCFHSMNEKIDREYFSDLGLYGVAEPRLCQHQCINRQVSTPPHWETTRPRLYFRWWEYLLLVYRNFP